MAQSPALRITASTLSATTTKAMFGKLPKAYQSAAVGICNQSNAALTVPQMRVAQQVKLTNGMVVLPRDVAITVIAAAQGSTTGAKIFRTSVAAIELAAIASSWAGISESIKATFSNLALAGGAALPVFSTAIPTHTYLTFDHEALPDPLNLSALGCAAGIAIVENAGSKNFDFTMELPKQP